MSYPCRIRRGQLRSPAPFLEDTSSLTAFKDDVFFSFLFLKVFGGDYGYSLDATWGSRCGLPKDWIPELLKTPQEGRHKSWDALATLFFGQAHNSSHVITNAHRLYGQALSELHSKLSDPNDWCSDSTLASITALYMYEVSHEVTALQKSID